MNTGTHVHSIVFAQAGILFILALCLTTAAIGCSPSAPNHSVRIDDLTLESDLLGKSMSLKVYVPGGYTETIRYPVLYFIADYGGSAYTVMEDYGIAEKAEQMIVNSEIAPLIIVGINIDRSFGINSSEKVETFDTTSGKTFHTGMYTDYVCKEILPLIESRYSTLSSRDGRYIGGYSMGGFAALHISFTHPELFSRAGGHSPSLFIEAFPDQTVSDWLYPTNELRAERDPVYLARKCDLSYLSVFLDVEAGGSQGVRFLYDILVAKGVDTSYLELSYSHSRTSCRANMDQYLRFYSGK